MSAQTLVPCAESWKATLKDTTPSSVLSPVNDGDKIEEIEISLED